MKIAVLLTCYNRKQTTLACLDRLFQQVKPKDCELSVYLVDDGSTDGTYEAVAEKYPQINLLKGNGDLFWNRGMLFAWENAYQDSSIEADLWLNDDVIMNDGALEYMITSSKMHKDSIIAASICSKNDEKVITYGGYDFNNKLINVGLEDERCRYFNGNIVLIPRTVSSKIGLLDNRFRHSLGDFEYGLRAGKNSINSYITPVIGKCDRNDPRVKWISDELSIIQRLKILYSPLGRNPFEAFYVKRYDSFWSACVLFIYLHLKAIFKIKNRKII